MIVVAIPTTEEEEEEQEQQGDGCDDDDYGAADWRDAAVAWEEAAAVAWMNNDNAAEARARSKQAEAVAAVAHARSNQVAEEVEEMADFIGWCLRLVFTCALLLWLWFG
ncbi:unnamed protein product [Miscanthus lutarioriparius]|uniref:Uncharacterized protein n=1 Tax=Miscanthus lutarioriparius TaxID=422564 RepID=A0A811RD02_9POAL|nr:unnamed protein product [Miscanthus lutarioriparius]